MTPTPGKYAQFRPGDVLGFYLEDIVDNNRGVVVLNSVTFTSELVWYASVASQKGGCLNTYSVGSSGDLNTLTRAAPVVSVSTGKLPVPLWLSNSFEPFSLFLQKPTIVHQ